MTKRATSTMASARRDWSSPSRFGGYWQWFRRSMRRLRANQPNRVGAWAGGRARWRPGDHEHTQGLRVHPGGGSKKVPRTDRESSLSGAELGILAPEDLSWFAILSFSDVGYVRDDDKDSLDADAMLASVQQGTEESNKERRRRGLEHDFGNRLDAVPPLRQPHAQSGVEPEGSRRRGQVVVNHYTRLLGRRG